MNAFNAYKNATASELNLTSADRRKLIDELTRALGIGGWSCPGKDGLCYWDVTDEEVADEWSKLECDAIAEDPDFIPVPSAFHIALLLATKWEYENLTYHAANIG